MKTQITIKNEQITKASEKNKDRHNDMNRLNRKSKRRCLVNSIEHKGQSGSRLPSSPSFFQFCTSTTTISDVDAVEDVFLNIISFFVGEKSIDAKSILNVMQVSKQWHSSSSSRTFWNQVPRLKSRPFDTLLTRCIRYTKIKKLPCERYNVFKVKERATGRMFRLEMNPQWRNNQGELQRHLREICLVTDMNELNLDCQKHLSLVKDWDVCDGHTLFFHEYAEDTLLTYIQKYDVCKQPQIVKAIITGILRGLHSLHQCSLIHRNLTLDHIAIMNSESFNEDTFPVAKIADFKYCKGGHELDADNCQTLSDLVGDVYSSRISAELKSVGNILFAMVGGCIGQKGCSLCIHRDECYENFQDINLDGLQKIIGADGVHFLNGLLSKNSDRCTSVLEALNHRYLLADLNTLSNDSVISFRTESNRRLQILHSLESSIHNDAGISDIIRFKPSQAAGMVDWLFEIASVFHISTRTVHVAVGYYNRCCRRSIVEQILGKEPQNYQLLAATCLHIASKCEDDIHVHAGNLSFSADRTFNQADIIAIEQKVLDAIEWKISIPTAYDFAISYMERIGLHSDNKLFWSTLYICELALESTIHIEYPPSIIAACAHVLATYSLNAKPIWTKEMEIISNYTLDNISKCLVRLSSVIEARHVLQQNSMIDRRYSKSSRMSVSVRKIKTIQSLTQLEALNPDL